MNNGDIFREACMSYIETQDVVSFDDLMRFMAILENRFGNMGIVFPYSDLHSFIKIGKDLGRLEVDPVRGISLKKKEGS